VCVYFHLGVPNMKFLKSRIITGFYIRFQVPAGSQQCRRILKCFLFWNYTFSQIFATLSFGWLNSTLHHPKNNLKKTLKFGYAPTQMLFSQSSDVAKKFGYRPDMKVLFIWGRGLICWNLLWKSSELYYCSLSTPQSWNLAKCSQKRTHVGDIIQRSQGLRTL
jgi:hypothetical protein